MMRARVIESCRVLLRGGMLRHGCGYRAYTGAAAAEVAAEPPSEKVLEVVDEVCGLNLMEMCELSELLRTKHNINDIPIMSMGMPGIGVPVPYMDIPLPGMGVGADSVAGVPAPVEAEVEKQAEKSVFDIKLEGYDASAKIKIIKEVRSFTDLGLKEAKELVEKAPSVLKQGVAKEQAEQILAKLKEMGAKVSLE